jgi:predicted AAA+ superfamily ATPase
MNVGHALETVVLNELERRGTEVGYLKTPSGWEVDFLARHPAGGTELLQVCAETGNPVTRESELRALADMAKTHPRATRRLLVLNSDSGAGINAPGITVQPANEWLLEPDA